MSRRHVTYSTVQGATVRVMRAGGSVKETLYAASSGSTQVANPMTAGQDGTVSAYVEGSDLVDLLVVAPAADPYSVTDVFVGSAGGGGAAPAGVSIVRAFPFAFDTPGLLTGAPLYTPTPGDVLLDAWVEMNTSWNGTTPMGDVGQFVGVGYGWFDGAELPLDMLALDTESAGTGYLSSLLNPAANTTQGTLALIGGAPNFRQAPGKFNTADPVKVVVSQDGTITGADPGSTQGAAVLYLVTATPA